MKVLRYMSSTAVAAAAAEGAVHQTDKCFTKKITMYVVTKYRPIATYAVL